MDLLDVASLLDGFQSLQVVLEFHRDGGVAEKDGFVPQLLIGRPQLLRQVLLERPRET